MNATESKPWYITSVLKNRCPRCRQGKLFQTDNPYDLKNNLKMNPQCPVCGQQTDLEVGFYYGTSYVSYALTVAFSVATCVAWYVLFGFSLENNNIFWWLGINSLLLIILQPPFMRLSRSLWISWFVKYDPNWQETSAQESERVIKEQMGNW
jgi:uncharacterized protein (DUF983 family)